MADNLGHQQPLQDLVKFVAAEVAAGINAFEAEHSGWRASAGDVTVRCALIVDEDTGATVAELNPSSQEPIQEITISLSRVPGS